jgi:hypothetical protein
MTILAIDPGPGTGFALLADTGLEVWQQQYDPLHGGHLKLYRALLDLRLGLDKIILEPFTFRKDDQTRDKIDFTAAEYVGVVRTFAQLYAVPLVLQQASITVGSTAFWGDSAQGNAKLRKLDLWDSRQAPHGMDALRHLLYYMTFTLNQDVWLQRLK